ncbi:hypothetical protein HHI36_020938 [Cryptolaemus montrouzieri]|uniref:Uncharacterized protein n=1 Tax=Cryptolaemus montrouzieri TaxID=559131 RepID=A0ABD2NCL5_9CUCU
MKFRMSYFECSESHDTKMKNQEKSGSSRKINSKSESQENKYFSKTGSVEQFRQPWHWYWSRPAISRSHKEIQEFNASRKRNKAMRKRKNFVLFNIMKVQKRPSLYEPPRRKLNKLTI